MRKWQDLAAKGDPNTWSDVSGMWPTGRGTYEVSDYNGSPGSNITATGETSVTSAWCFNTLSGQRAYLFGAAKVWELTSATAITDRTGALASFPTLACQYGNITIGARGTGASLVSSSGGDFSALAGSPSATYLVVQSNAVVAFNTSVSSDGWAASDVGDYTNWTTGEAASGRILEGNGAITAAVAYGNDIIVFKSDAIFRMTYVGGVVKWQIQKLVHGVGSTVTTGSGGMGAVATSRGVVFQGPSLNPSSSTAGYMWYLFDGSSAPVRINPLTTIRGGIPVYDPFNQMVCVYCYRFDGSSAQTRIYTYSLADDAWGYVGEYAGGSGTLLNYVPVRGDKGAQSFFGSSAATSPLRYMYRGGTNIVVPRTISLPTDASTSGSLVSHRYGVYGQTTTFKRMTPILRRRTSVSTPVCSGTYTPYTELHGSAGSTAALTESATRNRFDLLKSDAFATFTLSFSGLDAEVEDIKVDAVSAGTD